MLRDRLAENEGLLLVDREAGRLSAAIHMWLVFMPLGVAWLDNDRCVVDLRLARPWRAYVPRAPARYILEGPPSMLEKLTIGDELAFEESAAA